MTASFHPTAGPAEFADAALSKAVAMLRSGWLVLTRCEFGAGPGHPPMQVQYALLHAQFGIALVDVVPGRTAPGAAECLARHLDAIGFSETYGRNPPIVYVCVPLRAVSDIGLMLEQEFGQQPSFALPADGWMGAAKNILSAQPQTAPAFQSTRGDAGGQRGPRRMQDGQDAGGFSARRLGAGRLLVVFWGLIMAGIVSGASYLEYLGPPARTSRPADIAAPAPIPAEGTWRPSLAENSWSHADELAKTGASPLPDADPQRALMETNRAIDELQRRLKRFEPEAGVAAGIQAGSPELMQASPPRMPPIVQAHQVSGILAQSDEEPQIPLAQASPLATPQDAAVLSSDPVLKESASVDGFSALHSATQISTHSVGDAILPHGADTLAGRAKTASMGDTPVPVVVSAPRASDNVISSPAAPIGATMAELMIHRADAALMYGDVSAARLLYERAAAAGSGRAATAMGKTYDLAFLDGLNVARVIADPAKAAMWYRRGLALGDNEGAVRLQALSPETDRASVAQNGRP